LFGFSFFPVTAFPVVNCISNISALLPPWYRIWLLQFLLGLSSTVPVPLVSLQLSPVFILSPFFLPSPVLFGFFFFPVLLSQLSHVSSIFVLPYRPLKLITWCT
jgi:hypothetical protein